MEDTNSENITPSGTETPFKVGIYWRKSRWNGRQTVPVIVTLQNGLFSMKTDQETVFSVSCNNVIVTFSKLGTVFVNISGKKYALYGSGSGISKPFSKEQLAELSETNNSSKEMRMGAAAQIVGLLSQSSAGLAIGGVTGALFETVGIYEGQKDIKKLSDGLKRYGVQVNGTPPKPNLVKLILYTILIGVGGAILTIILVVIVVLIFKHK